MLGCQANCFGERLRRDVPRMRAASTSRPVSDLRSEAAAPPVAASAVESALHSACHAPVARSCSCTTLSNEDSRVRTRVTLARDGEHGSDGVALVGHRRGSAWCTLGDLSHLGLRQQHDVRGDLRRRSCDAGERARQLGNGVLIVCQDTVGSRNPSSSE